MRNVRVIGKLTYPHFIKMEAGNFITEKVEEFNQAANKMQTKEKQVMANGLMSVICHPDDLLLDGEEVLHPFYNSIKYKVVKTNETHAVKGDWSFEDFNPICQVVELETMPNV